METFISLMTRSSGNLLLGKENSGNDVPFIEGREDVDKKEKIALEIDILRDVRRHWNHSTPRAKNTHSRTEMASGRQGLLQPKMWLLGT